MATRDDSPHATAPMDGRPWADPMLVILLAAVSPAFLIAISIVEPYAGKALGLPADEIIWFNESFMVGTLMLTPMTGSLLSRFGFVRVMRVSLVGALFMSALVLLAGFFPAIGTQVHIVAMFLALGAFTAAMAPAAQAFVVATRSRDERGRGMADWGFGRFAGFMLTALVVGPVIEAFGWSAIMAIGPLLLLPSLFLLRQPVDLVYDSKALQDLKGPLLLLLAILPLLIVMNVAPNLHTGTGFWVAAIAAGSLLALWGFVRHEGHSDLPAVSLEPFSNRNFATATVIAFVVAIMTTGQFSILMLSEVAHVSADWISWRTAVGGLGQIAGVVLGGYLAKPLLARPAAVAALVLAALGLASFNLYGTTVDLPSICLTRALMGLGLGISVPVLADFAYKFIPDRLTGAATSLFVFAGMLGTELGLALLGSIFTEVAAVTADPLYSYRVVFCIEAAGTVAVLPLIFFLRAGSPTAAARP